MVCYKDHVQVGSNMESVKDAPHMTLMYGDDLNHPKENSFYLFSTIALFIFS